MIPIHWLYKFFWLCRTLVFRFIFKKIGFSSYIGRPIFLKGTSHISIGDKVRIFPNSRMEVHKNGHLTFEDNVSIGQNFHIVASGQITIRNGTLISANVFISDTEHTFDILHISLSDQPISTKPTRIGKNCFIGFGAVIMPGSIIGDNCVVGSNTTVKGTFPDNSVIAGSPAKILRYR